MVAWIGECSIPAAVSPTAFEIRRRSLGEDRRRGSRRQRIEALLSLKSVLPDPPAVAALSIGYAAWDFPSGPRRLVACDNEDAGRSAARRSKERTEAVGRT